MASALMSSLLRRVPMNRCRLLRRCLAVPEDMRLLNELLQSPWAVLQPSAFPARNDLSDFAAISSELHGTGSQ